MNISRNYNRGKSFRYSTWEVGKVYKNDDYVQDFVKYNGILYACVAPFTSKRPDYVLKNPDIRGDWDVVVDGVGISDMLVEYGNSATEEKPTTWYKDVPETPQGSYLWTKITYIFKDGSSEISFQKSYVSKDGIVGEQGPQGEKGEQGDNGEDGITPDIKINEDNYWCVSYDGGLTYSDLLDNEGNPVSAIGINGADGAPGQDGVDGKDGITPKFKIENDFWYVSYDNEETWIETGKAKGEDGQGSSEIAESTEDNKNFIVVETVGEGQAIAVREIDSDKTVLSKPITVAGLSGTLGAGNYKNNDVIPAGTDLYTILQKLLCKEIYPSSITSVSGTFTAKSGIGATTITKSDSLVEPGTTITFTIKQGSVSGYNQTSHSVSGLTYGYSLENDNSKDGDTTSFSKNWSISKTDSNYSLKIIGGGEENTLTGTTPQTGTCSFAAVIGTNTCSVTSSGEETYVGSIEEIPVYYAVSNIGNTDEEYKSKKLEGATDVEIKSIGSLTSSESITCVYPVYHNVSSNTLDSDTTTKMSLSKETSYSISSIPSEEVSGKQFMFDFPENATISKMAVTYLPNKYNVYSNINNDVIGSEFNKSHGSWKTTIEITGVPGEEGNTRFGIEYPACAELDRVEGFDGITNSYKTYSQYKTEPVKRGSDSYTRLTMTHEMASGETKYKFYFKSTSTPKTTSDYTITSGITKTINGTVYNYKRLTTTSQSGWVDRVITFNKALNNI